MVETLVAKCHPEMLPKNKRGCSPGATSDTPPKDKKFLIQPALYSGRRDPPGLDVRGPLLEGPWLREGVEARLGALLLEGWLGWLRW